LRGGSKDVLNEIERNLQDALAVAKNLAVKPTLVPGGGAAEMELSHRYISHKFKNIKYFLSSIKTERLNEKAKTIEGQEQMPLRAVAYALEVIPRTLA
jgi:T-complex protein 1 subunit gamma